MKDYEIEREVERKYLEIDRFLNIIYFIYTVWTKFLGKLYGRKASKSKEIKKV